MNQVAPRRVWIGHGGEGHDFTQILDLGIEAVVELAEEEPSFPTRRDMIACRFPLIDGSGNRPEVLELAVATLARLIAADVPTLVCCSMGLSRAPALVAAALARVERTSHHECLKRVTWHHPSDVSPGLWQELIALPLEGK